MASVVSQPPKDTSLAELRLRRGLVDVFFGGKIPKFNTYNTKYAMKLGHVYPGGYIGLLVPELDVRRIDNHLTKIYEDEKNCFSLKLQLDQELMQNMMVVWRPPSGQQHEVFRGLVHSVEQQNTNIVNILLVDELETVGVSRNELYNVTRDYHRTEFLANVSRLDKLDFFYGTEQLDRVAKRLADSHFDEDVEVRYKKPSDDGSYKVHIKLQTGQRLNKLIFDEINEMGAGRFPTEGEKTEGIIVHAEENGDVFVQLVDSLSQCLTDWLAEKGHEKVNALRKLKQGVKIFDENSIYLAPFDGELYRAKILKDIDADQVLVQYIDFGNTGNVWKVSLVLAKDVDDALEKLPPLCFQIRMKWVDKIIDVESFLNLVDDNVMELEVRRGKADGYPVVHVNDLSKDPHDSEYSVNKLIIKKKFATFKK